MHAGCNTVYQSKKKRVEEEGQERGRRGAQER
jgi:hypothetical protein